MITYVKKNNYFVSLKNSLIMLYDIFGDE